MTDWILMKLVDIINQTAYSKLSKLHSLSKLCLQILTKVERNDASYHHQRFAIIITGLDIYISDWLRLCHAEQHIYYSHLFFCSLFLPQQCSIFLKRLPQVRFGGGRVSDVINNTAMMKAIGTLPPIFLSLLFSSCPATHLCSTRVPRRSRVWLEFI